MFKSLPLTCRSASVVIISALVAAAIACAADPEPFWPQFHGPKRDNLSSEKALLKSWPEGGPALLWKAKGLGHGFSSVSIASGMLYTSGNIEDYTVISALNTDGKALWQVRSGGAWTKDRPGTRGTPTIDGHLLYHESPLGDVICLDARTGDRIWQLNIIDKFQSKTATWALCESLLIDRDHVICCPGGPQTCMVALDKKTGAVVWKAPSINEFAGYSSPTLAECQGLRIITTLTSKAIIGVNADTGELLWHVKHESYADENIMMPLYYDGCVFISTLQAGSVKWRINVKDGRASLEELWRTDQLDNQHGGVMLLDGRLHGASSIRNSGLWVCLDWQTGRTLYSDPLVGRGSLTWADGLLYTLGENGLMALVRTTPTAYQMISSFQIPQGGEGMSWSHPVVCGGRLYIRHDDLLYAYALR